MVLFSSAAFQTIFGMETVGSLVTGWLLSGKMLSFRLWTNITKIFRAFSVGFWM